MPAREIVRCRNARRVVRREGVPCVMHCGTAKWLWAGMAIAPKQKVIARIVLDPLADT